LTNNVNMNFELNRAMEILERTPKILRAYLKDLSSEWISENEGNDTWSPCDIVGHLIHGERTDWIIRAKIILSKRKENTFEPFDRFAQFTNNKGKSLNELLVEFEQLRSQNIEELKTLNISDKELTLQGVHPELGTVNLKQLLSTWVVHDLGHIIQISRVMAKQYKEEVGPWKEYIGILKDRNR